MDDRRDHSPSNPDFRWSGPSTDIRNLATPAQLDERRRQATTVDRVVEQTRQNHDAEMAKIADPDWKAAKEFEYKCGIRGLAELFYKVALLERRVSELAGAGKA